MQKQCIFPGLIGSSSNVNLSEVTITAYFIGHSNYREYYKRTVNRNSLFGLKVAADQSETFSPTQLGSATLASALSPDEALVVFRELQKARRCFVLENELHLVYEVTICR